MKLLITKQLIVSEVKGTRVSKAPFEVVFEGRHQDGRVSRITANEAFFERHVIKPSLEMAGRTIEVVLDPFECDEIARGVGQRKLGPDHVVVEHFEAIEELRFFGSALSQRHGSQRKRFVLEVATLHPGLGDVPCPRIQLFLELDEKEAEMLKSLPLSAKTAFDTSFRLLSR